MSADEEFNDTIRHMMLRTGDTQAEIGKALGLGQAAVSARMIGRTRWNLAEVHALAEHWGVHPADLLLGPAAALAAYDKPVGKSSGQVPAIADATPSPKNEIG